MTRPTARPSAISAGRRSSSRVPCASGDTLRAETVVLAKRESRSRTGLRNRDLRAARLQSARRGSRLLPPRGAHAEEAAMSARSPSAPGSSCPETARASRKRRPASARGCADPRPGGLGQRGAAAAGTRAGVRLSRCAHRAGAGQQLWVRVNALSSGKLSADLAGRACRGAPDGDRAAQSVARARSARGRRAA